MKTWSRVILGAALCLFCASLTFAQRTRKPKAAAPAQPATAGSAKKKDPRTEAAERVAEQIKTLTKFLYLYGGVTKDLIEADAAVQRGEGSREAAQQVRQNKAALIGSLRNVRDGLDKLEADFRFTPQLQRYYPQLKGVATSATSAEEQAADGKYQEAGRALLEVVNQLTDVLAAMR